MARVDVFPGDERDLSQIYGDMHGGASMSRGDDCPGPTPYDVPTTDDLVRADDGQPGAVSIEARGAGVKFTGNPRNIGTLLVYGTDKGMGPNVHFLFHQ